MTDAVETLPLREDTSFEESSRHLIVEAVAELLLHERHDLVRDSSETDAEYISRNELFGALIHHAWRE